MAYFETINTHEAYNAAKDADDMLATIIEEAYEKLEEADPYAEFDEFDLGTNIAYLENGDDEAKNIATWLTLNAARFYGDTEATILEDARELDC